MTLVHLPVFVYGTLKRGEERAPLWPHEPTLVEPATTKGRLYDLGSYPALVPGGDIVLGELWHFHQQHLANTLQVVDAIECYDQGGVDLYVRRIVECRSADGDGHRAYTYQYAQERTLSGFHIVKPDSDGLCHWLSGKQA